MTERQKIALKYMNVAEWLSSTEGVCECPFGHDDARVYLDKVPTVHCMHQRCADEVSEINDELRREIRENERERGVKWKPTEHDFRRWAAQRIQARLDALSEYHLPAIVKDTVKEEDFLSRSPVKLESIRRRDHWRHLLNCFPSRTRVWIGEKEDSGAPWHKRHFREVEDWLDRCDLAPGSLICPCDFVKMAFSRSNDSVHSRIFLVVESDELTPEEVGGVFEFIEKGSGLDLAAIVNTGGKSLHGWFPQPQGWSQEDWKNLKMLLHGLRCDAGMLGESQPARLPGSIRKDEDGQPTGRWQRLIYLDPGALSRAEGCRPPPPHEWLSNPDPLDPAWRNLLASKFYDKTSFRYVARQKLEGDWKNDICHGLDWKNHPEASAATAIRWGVERSIPDAVVRKELACCLKERSAIASASLTMSTNAHSENPFS